MKVYALWGIALVFSTSALAQNSAHTGYWNDRTDKGAEFKCESATSKRRMMEILQSAGWPVDRGIPLVNWSTEEVVVVAPSKYYKSAHLAFYGLKREGDTIVLDYGWAAIKDSQRISANVISFGSTTPGYAATIVVAYQRGLDAGLSFVCRDRGIVG